MNRIFYTAINMYDSFDSGRCNLLKADSDQIWNLIAKDAEIQRAAKTGIYDIRGFGAKREIPTFDDLVFLGASKID